MPSEGPDSIFRGDRDDHYYIANLARLYNEWTGSGHEGVDTFGETCIHEGLHMTHYNQWDEQTDTDGDLIPDSVEDANSNEVYDPPTDPSDWQDKFTFYEDINDEELLCLDAMWTWSLGSVDSQDWANPGHQY